MIVHRRAARLWVFGTDDRSVQLCWRGLRPGILHVEIEGRREPAVLELGGEGSGEPHLASAGAVTIDALPPGRQLRIEANGAALAEPTVLTARTLATLPGPELTRMATLSDLHVGTEVFGHRGGIRERASHDRPHPERCTEAAITESTAWGARRLAVKGDLTNAGLPHQWRSYASLLEAATIPVDAIAGNHDSGAYGGPRALSPADAAPAFGLSIAQPTLVRDLPGLRLVLADTTIPKRNRGTLSHIEDDVVDAVAEAPAGGGVLVLLHHQLQPHRPPEGWPPGVAHRDSVRFLERLGRVHRHVLVSSGHTHRNRRWGRAGVVVTQVGSTKDYPGVWAGYRVHESGIAQTVHRVERADCVSWTDHSRTAAYGLWEHASPGRMDARCFNVAW